LSHFSTSEYIADLKLINSTQKKNNSSQVAVESPGWREVQEVSVQDKKRHIPGGRPESRGSEEGKITQKRKNTSQVVGQSLERGRRER